MDKLLSNGQYLLHTLVCVITLSLTSDFEIVKWVACMAEWGLSFDKSEDVWPS